MSVCIDTTETVLRAEKVLKEFRIERHGNWNEIDISIKKTKYMVVNTGREVEEITETRFKE